MMSGEYEEFSLQPLKSCEQEIRSKFLRVVLGIFTLQFFVVLLVTCFVIQFKSFHEWCGANWPFTLGCGLVFLVLLILPLALENQIKRLSVKLAILTIFTISKSFLIGSCAAFFDPMTVLVVPLATLASVAGVAVINCSSKSNFGAGKSATCGLGFASVMFLVYLVLFYQEREIGLLICFAVVICFTVFVVIDIKFNIEGEVWNLKAGDYIVAPLFFYIDLIKAIIILLFLAVIGALKIISDCDICFR